MQDIEMILEIWDLIKSNTNSKDRNMIAEKYLELVSGYGVDIDQNKEEFFGHCSVLTFIIKELFLENHYDDYEDYEE